MKSDISNCRAMMEPLESRQMLSAVSVMTQNVYYGGPGLFDIGDSLTNLGENVQDSKIPERAAAIAAEIKREKPDLVGLQEVVIWRTGSIFDSSPDDVK